MFLAVGSVKKGEAACVQLRGDMGPVLFSNFVVSQNLWSYSQSQRMTKSGQGKDIFITVLTCILPHDVFKNEQVIVPLRVIFSENTIGAWPDPCCRKGICRN